VLTAETVVAFGRGDDVFMMPILSTPSAAAWDLPIGARDPPPFQKETSFF